METFAALLPSSSNAATLQQTFFMVLGTFGAKGSMTRNAEHGMIICILILMFAVFSSNFYPTSSDSIMFVKHMSNTAAWQMAKPVYVCAHVWFKSHMGQNWEILTAAAGWTIFIGDMSIKLGKVQRSYLIWYARFAGHHAGREEGTDESGMICPNDILYA